MERQNRLSVTIVNRNYPPNKSVTAESASDLAKHLIQNNMEVKVVYTDGSYPGGGAGGEVVGETHKVKSVYSGKNVFRRLFGSLLEGYRMIKKAKEVNEGIIIVMTSPPLLNFWASFLLKKNNIPYVLWSMDLYPEAFVASGLIRKNNPIYSYFFKKTYDYKPKGLIALGEIQRDYLIACYNENIPSCILPCGVFLHNNGAQEVDSYLPEWKKEDDKIYLGYIGNLGEAHSVDFIKWVADNIDPEKHRLILVVYGSKSMKVKNYLSHRHKGVVLLDFVPRHQLKHIDVHLVSLLPEWVNLCVPSKLVSAVHNGSIFLFYGVEQCDSWQYLNPAGWKIEASDYAEDDIKNFLKDLSKEKIQNKKEASNSMSKTLENNTSKAYDEVVQLLLRINQPISNDSKNKLEHSITK